MITCAWRLKRVTRIETSILFDLCKKQESTDESTLGRAYSQGAPALNTLSRYERQLERSLCQTQQELELLLFARATQDEPYYVRNRKKFPAPGEQQIRRQAVPRTQHRSSDTLEFA